MKVETVDLSVERKLCTLCIMNDRVCQTLLPILDKNGVKTAYAVHLISWVKEYNLAYSEAPKGAIKEIFEQKKPTIRDEEVASSISTFLESLADDYDEDDYSNIDFHIKDCEKYIRKNNLEALQEKIKTALSVGDVIKAESMVAGFTQKAIPESQGVSLLNDVPKFAEAFDEDHLEPMFQFNGDLGRCLGPIHRGDFSAVLATSKAKKSWECQYFAETSMAAGFKTLVVNLEMRDIELRQRYWRGLVNAPFITGPVSIPFFRPDKELSENETDDNVTYRIDYKVVNKQGVSFADTKTLMDTMHMRYKTGDIKLISLPAYSTGWPQIEAVLDNLLYYDGWACDCLIVDYLDLLYSKENEYRQKINDLWSQGRKVALERNLHLHTASQSNASGNSGAEITLDSISEDQRKKSHVSLLYGAWATESESEKQIVHIKRLLGRGKQTTFESCVVLQNLDCGQYCVASKLASKVEGV